MTNSLASISSAAAFLVLALCAAPLVAQETAQPEAPADAPAAETTTTTTTPQPAAASPGIRIVRLSQVTGEVQMDRQTGNGLEAAFANLPIVQGSKLRTGEGVAEVEFEDNSSLRLTPHSLVEFPVLSANASGVHTSTIHVAEGTVYVSLTKNKDNHVNVTFGKETLALSPSAHIELALNEKQPRLDVLDGTVEAVNGATTTTVGKKKALLFDPTNATAPTLVSKNETGPYAEWDKKQVEYHNHFAPSSSSHYAGTPYSYGLADMNYYGGFSNLGGCGMMWQPYLAGAGFSPFANGSWAWYPGAGYSWVSPYPWGWTAFHSGSWNYCPGAGWGWQPNNNWNGLRNTAAVTIPKKPTGLRPPIARPHPLAPTVVTVNQKPLIASKLNQNTFVFQKGSAGLGVPRGTFGKLNHISTNVNQHGSAQREVFFPGAENTAGSRQQNMPGRTAANQGNTNTAAHTMPGTGRASMPTHSAPSGGSMGGGTHSAPVMSGGGGSRPMGGGGGAMGGGHASAGPSGGGHH
jgi:hypothetical protein